jgi:hypothetical protein
LTARRFSAAPAVFGTAQVLPPAGFFIDDDLRARQRHKSENMRIILIRNISYILQY